MKDETSIIVFDGVCNLCASAVAFIIRRDPKARFRFAALQSGAGRTLLEQNGLTADALDTLVLLENGMAFTRSTAALRIARKLRGPWPCLFLLLVIPRPIRDAIYSLIARNRHHWFGRRSVCLVPTPDIKKRFLE